MSTSAYAHVSSSDTAAWANPVPLPHSDSSSHEASSAFHDTELGVAPSSSSFSSSGPHQSFDQPGQPQQGTPPSKHKVATFFHLFFKIAAIATYLLCSMFIDNFILVFVICVLLLSFDFWSVKNVTGRLLVGLRWWNEVKEDGTNVWIFESKPENRAIHPTDSMVFWSTLYATPVVWILLGIGELLRLRFHWLLIVCVAVTLTGANVVGYWKCQKDAGRRVKSFIAQQVLNAAVPGQNNLPNPV